MRFIFYFIFLILVSVSTYAVDIVNVIAPSCKSDVSKITSMKEYVESLGFKARIAKKIFSNDNPFYSNSDEFRANDLVNALTGDSEIIWCIKGGKGAARLIPYLENLPDTIKQKIANNKKILIGYSDITALHIYLQNKYNWHTLYATMLEMIVDGSVAQSSVDKLESLILNKQSFIRFDNISTVNNGYELKNDHLQSKIIGGNMTLVENSIGTIWQIDVKNKILFLEDIAVHPYAIERSLDHLKQARIFDGVRAVIFGDFIKSGDDHLIKVVQERFAKNVSFPVFTLTGVGHGYVNDPLPLNTRAVITVHNGEVSMIVDYGTE